MEQLPHGLALFSSAACALFVTVVLRARRGAV